MRPREKGGQPPKGSRLRAENQCPSAVNVVVFANRVFVDIIKLKGDKTRLEWILNSVMGALIGRRKQLSQETNKGTIEIGGPLQLTQDAENTKH